MRVDSFIDTNVFIYHLDHSDPRKQAIAEGIVREALSLGTGCISLQVVHECMNTVLRKAEVALSPAQAETYLDAVLAPLVRVPSTTAVVQRALDIQQRWRFGFYDSLIVAAALTAGCTRLLTEDLQHGQRIETLTVENPFLVSAAD
jgi:predicted nucleic acid-binding protein